MEHICFEVQLCIQKSILHEFCGIPGIWQIGCRAVGDRCVTFLIQNVELGLTVYSHLYGPSGIDLTAEHYQFGP